MRKLLLCLFILLLSGSMLTAYGQTIPTKKVLVLVEGKYDVKNIPTAMGREMAQLLGHFKTVVTIEGMTTYKAHEISQYDFVFYIGYSANDQVPKTFSNDVLTSTKPIVWINTGFIDFAQNPAVAQRYGFTVTAHDAASPYTAVKVGNDIFTKGTSDINIVKVIDKKKVAVWATAITAKGKNNAIPYMVQSGNLTYVADLPFLGATETDHYLYFADKLHDILGENHPVNHQAIIRIEDVTALNDPNELRDIADYLSEQGIPFLVGVVPIYVNPSEGRYVRLSDRPELVDALKYMVRNGGSIVMHGVTHQYKGVSTDDAEFWNMTANAPIVGENVEDFSKKIELGLNEFYKNNLFPIAWETPHYMGTIKAYTAISKYFSTAVEQRMVIDNFDYGQYFPYIIQKDIYGQKIYPENLGYVPLSPSIDTSMVAVNRIIKNAMAINKVRDGVACAFFHPFLNISLLKKLVEGLKKENFNFIDLRDDNNWVKLPDKITLTGDEPKSYELTLDQSFLNERYFNDKSQIVKNITSDQRYNGVVKKDVTLTKGELYVAEGVEFHLKEPTFIDKVVQKTRTYIANKTGNERWKEARVGVCWNPQARGAAYNDQSSLVSIFKSLNINVDTVFVGKADIQYNGQNLLVVPFAAVDSLSYFEKQNILHFVEDGGTLITDGKNKLIEHLGFKFLNSDVPIHQIRDSYYPEEIISWYEGVRAPKFESNDDDEVFAEDAATSLPVAVGRKIGKGKVIYFSTLFDPLSMEGYSRFPFVMEYIKRFCQLQPVVKRENLEVYFDPGLRQNSSVENLIKMWSKEGIRTIHIAGWHQYPKYNYDYNRIIRLAHANGMLAYAWLEPPQVNQKFWEQHPEWREKNYLGKDVRPSWRYPIALTDEACLKTAIQDYMNFLKEYDWDGVNLGEVYFEAGKGFSEPEKFTPMHPSARAEFQRKYGFDMRQIFNKQSEYYWQNNPKAKADVVNYRVNKIAEIHDRFLQAISDFAKTKKGFGVIVTFMDTYFSPEIMTYHGSSSDKMLELQKKYHCYLQPEDPQSMWSTDPSRYAAFGKYYAERMAEPEKLMVDLNILSFRDKNQVTSFPTLIQTGIESYQMINSAATGAPRFTIYSEATCNPEDMPYFSYASSAPVKYDYTEDGYKVNSPYSFVLQLPKKIKVIQVDGQDVIGYRENNFLIPAGEHNITVSENSSQFSTVELQPQLLSFTGNLLDIKYDMRQVSFSYTSYERAYASFNREPTAITVDGHAYKFEVLTGNDGFAVMLPSGKHKVEVVTGDKFTYNINLTSLWSISAIAIYGFLAVSLLVIMYLALKLLRKRLEK